MILYFMILLFNKSNFVESHEILSYTTWSYSWIKRGKWIDLMAKWDFYLRGVLNINYSIMYLDFFSDLYDYYVWKNILRSCCRIKYLNMLRDYCYKSHKYAIWMNLSVTEKTEELYIYIYLYAYIFVNVCIYSHYIIIVYT